jgi:3-carboxy-cis,cis-muconate cycloisomerase
MIRNIVNDQGLLMAEAYMMQLAGRLGREVAHDVVYDAAQVARMEKISLWDALKASAVADARLEGVIIKETAVQDYLGDIDVTCSAAVRLWLSSARSRDRSTEPSFSMASFVDDRSGA